MWTRNWKSVFISCASRRLGLSLRLQLPRFLIIKIQHTNRRFGLLRSSGPSIVLIMVRRASLFNRETC